MSDTSMLGGGGGVGSITNRRIKVIISALNLSTPII